MHLGGLPAVTAVFYGVRSSVIALIVHSGYRTGKVAKVAPLTGSEDFIAATAQRAAMTMAKRALPEVVDAAVNLLRTSSWAAWRARDATVSEVLHRSTVHNT